MAKHWGQLQEDKATGPDNLSARILKRCAKELSLPVAKLTRTILKTGCWPKEWRKHWIVPLYKRKAVWNPSNYRGVHLTAQLSKVVERILGSFFLPFLEKTQAYGPNQFAYRKKRGCRDLLALNLLDWTWNLHNGRKVALYCSDVSGAFDRVDTDRLLEKLQRKGLKGELLAVVRSWLGERTAQVVVDGAFSDEATLKNSVYQGTVWGPPLWNVFFADARVPILQAGFTDAFFADDLNCFKSFDGKCPNKVLSEAMEECQEALHRWGAANKVQFDSSKESLHILHKRFPEGENFVMFGIEFDSKLSMKDAIRKIANRCHWKLRTLLRSQRFFSEQEMVQQYKSHILSFLEFATPALYHATKTDLEPLDRVQDAFLRRLGLTAVQALEKYRLAPLSTRRDVALLGMVHRTVLGDGPDQFRKWFFPAAPSGHTQHTRATTAKHDRQLHDYLDRKQSALLRRSVLCLPRVYNSLPAEVVACKTVKDFQRALQKIVLGKAKAGEENWERCFKFKPRVTFRD